MYRIAALGVCWAFSLCVDCGKLSLLRGTITVLDSKTLWKQTPTVSDVCDGLCVKTSDLAHMPGMDSGEVDRVTFQGSTWVCKRVCPFMDQVHPGTQIVTLGPNTGGCLITGSRSLLSSEEEPPEIKTYRNETEPQHNKLVNSTREINNNTMNKIAETLQSISN